MMEKLMTLMILVSSCKGIMAMPKGDDDVAMASAGARLARSTELDGDSLLDVPKSGMEDEVRTAIIVNQVMLAKISDAMNKFLNASVTEEKQKECPSPYIRVNSECFYIHEHPQTDWDTAATFCRRIGGSLAEPESVELLHAVIMQRPETEPKFWLGASDPTRSRQWTWVSGKPVDLSQPAWVKGEPNYHPGTENCVELQVLRYPALNAALCSVLRSFVCEYN